MATEHSTTSITGGHANAVAAGAAGFMTGADKTKLDGIATGANVTGANAPQAHAASHKGGGSDAIDAVVAAGASGLMTGADKTKLDGIAAGANVTGANAPQAHAASHKGGGSDAIDNAVAAGAAGLMSGTDKTKLDGIAASAVGLSLSWGSVAAPATASARYFARTGAAVGSSVVVGTYPCPVAGSRTVTLTWNVSGTPLVTDTITLALMVNGSASALTATMGAGATSGQASATLTLAVGDSLAIRLTQSSTEAQSTWSGSVNISA